jgi:excisionase family DNA binding protein
MGSETPLSDVRFLTVAEVATIMRVSKMTVYKLVHSGELEAIRVGRSFRVPEPAVSHYLRGTFIAAGIAASGRNFYGSNSPSATNAPPGPGFDDDDE